MKLQFSLATMLLCMTVLAVDSAFCMRLKAFHMISVSEQYVGTATKKIITVVSQSPQTEPPTIAEIILRFAWSVPLSIAATLSALWFIRRLCIHAKATRIHAHTDD